MSDEKQPTASMAAKQKKMVRSAAIKRRLDSLRSHWVKSHKASSTNSVAINAEVIEVTESGIVIAVGENRVTYTFRASKFTGYAGEPFSDVGIKRGAPVRIKNKHGAVSSCSLRK